MPVHLNRFFATLLAFGAIQIAHAQTGYRQELLVPGVPFKGVHGMAFDREGHLLACNVLGETVHIVNIENGGVSTLVGPPVGESDDIVVGPDGSVYWTRFISGKLMRRLPDGVVRVVADGLPGINSLAFRRDGRLYVSQVMRGDALWEVDPDGVWPPRKLIAGLGGLNGFQFGADDRLYGPIMTRGQIVRIDVDTAQVGVVASGLGFPTAARFDHHQQLYVVDSARGELVRVNTATGNKSVAAKLAPGLDNLAIGPDDRIYVSNMVDNDIRVVTPSDGMIRTVVPGRLAVSAGLAVAVGDPNEKIHLADGYAYRQIDGRDGRLLNTLRPFSSALALPINISVGKHVVTSSWYVNAIQVLDRASGEILHTLVDDHGVQGIVELDDGALLVAEGKTGALVRIDPARPDSRTVLADGLGGPVGLVKVGTSVYVTEIKMGRITRVSIADGRKTVVVSGLRAPEGIAWHPDGGLIVAEVGRRRLLRIDPASGRHRVIADLLPIGLPELPAMPPGYLPTGVAVGASGAIYMTSDIEGAVYRFVPLHQPHVSEAGKQ